MNRNDGRAPDQLRPIVFHTNYLQHPPGSVLIEAGKTRVICAAARVPGAPRWMKEQSVHGGWVTSEYAMLPGATAERKPRPGRIGRTDARALEIQRLIGRSLRAVVALTKLGDNSIYVDCDVIDADGGTRCAAISGAAVALQLACRNLFANKVISGLPMRELVAAVSVGIVDGQPLLDLDYPEDVAAEVDMNVVMTESGKFVEIQGTAEENPFDRPQMDAMLALAEKGIREIIEFQKTALSA